LLGYFAKPLLYDATKYPLMIQGCGLLIEGISARETENPLENQQWVW
jgi:hypothetical protein